MEGTKYAIHSIGKQRMHSQYDLQDIDWILNTLQLVIENIHRENVKYWRGRKNATASKNLSR